MVHDQGHDHHLAGDSQTLKPNVVEISDGAGHYFKVPSLTKAQRNALTPINGMSIYVSDETPPQVMNYENGAWVGCSSSPLSEVTIDVNKDWNAKSITNMLNLTVTNNLTTAYFKMKEYTQADKPTTAQLPDGWMCRWHKTGSEEWWMCWNSGDVVRGVRFT